MVRLRYSVLCETYPVLNGRLILQSAGCCWIPDGWTDRARGMTEGRARAKDLPKVVGLFPRHRLEAARRSHTSDLRETAFRVPSIPRYEPQRFISGRKYPTGAVT